MTTVFSLKTFNSFLSNVTLQLSSHNCPRDINEELWRFGRTVAILAFVDNRLFSGMVPDRVEGIGWAFGSVTDIEVLG